MPPNSSFPPLLLQPLPDLTGEGERRVTSTPETADSTQQFLQDNFADFTTSASIDFLLADQNKMAAPDSEIEIAYTTKLPDVDAIENSYENKTDVIYDDDIDAIIDLATTDADIMIPTTTTERKFEFNLILGENIPIDSLQTKSPIDNKEIDAFKDYDGINNDVATTVRGIDDMSTESVDGISTNPANSISTTFASTSFTDDYETIEGSLNGETESNSFEETTTTTIDRTTLVPRVENELSTLDQDYDYQRLGFGLGEYKNTFL